MQRAPVAQPDEQVLAARDDVDDLGAAEVGGGMRRHAELADGEDAAGQALAQALRGEPDGVALGHG